MRYDAMPCHAVARAFRRKDITYTRLGMEDFDFGAHNRTGYSGLEAHSPNAYCNPLLQTWYHVEPIRSLLLDHLCTKDNCLACELAFFFHMVDRMS
jgi:PAB-dependent poly(A)-specific ribonuclease subunit 2